LGGFSFLTCDTCPRNITTDIDFTMISVQFLVLAVFALISKECRGFTFRTGVRTGRSIAPLYCTPVMEKVVPKVPSSAWKWPKGWPFPVDFLELVDLDAGNKTTLSQPVINVFQQHVKNSMFDGASVLEIGDMKTFFSTNSKLDSFDVTTLAGPLPFESNSYDRIVVSAGIESLVDPRSLFRDIWRMLKPGGTCITCFSGKNYSPSDKSAKMWTTMNDEQKIWIAGSYFHYSAGPGWEAIEGYDLLGSTGEKKMIFESDSKAQDGTAYVVSANKIVIPTMDSEDFSVYNYTKQSLLGSSTLDMDDLEFTALRISTDFSKAETRLEKQTILDSIPKLTGIYEVLKNVKEVVIPTPVKAMLAVFLLSKWDNTEDQRLALRLGLGLEKGNEEFWIPVGTATSAMPPREKILFLSEIIPEFGRNANLERLPDLLKELLTTIREKVGILTDEASLQIFVADLAVTDFIFSKNPDQNAAYNRVTKFISQSDTATLTEMIADRMTNTLK
jgi:SAM-dependent methyltransferase